MKRYINNLIILTAFIFIFMFSLSLKADASIGFSIGFGGSNYSSGYNYYDGG